MPTEPPPLSFLSSAGRPYSSRDEFILHETVEAVRQILSGLETARSMKEPQFRAAEGLAIALFESFADAGKELALQILQPLLQDLVLVSDRQGCMVSPELEEVLQEAEALGMTFTGGAQKRLSTVGLFLRIGRGYFVAAVLGVVAFAIAAPFYLWLQPADALPWFWMASVVVVITIAVLLAIGRPALRLPGLKVALGTLALRAGATAFGISLLSQAAQTLEDRPEIHVALGRAYLRAGHMDRAQQELGKVIGLALRTPTASP